MRVSFHPGSDPYQRMSPFPKLLAGRLDAVYLMEGVDYDAPDSLLQGETDFLHRFVVAMEPEPLRRHPPGQGDPHLPHGRHIQVEPFLGNPARHRPGQQCLSCVIDPPPGKIVAEGPRSDAEILFVDHVGGCALLGRNPRQGDPTNHDAPHLVPFGPCRPQLRSQLIQVLGQREPLRSCFGDIGVNRTGDVSMSHEAKACQKGRTGADETPTHPTKRAQRAEAVRAPQREYRNSEREDLGQPQPAEQADEGLQGEHEQPKGHDDQVGPAAELIRNELG